MNMPWQIYCDFLEDKGFDARLLRSLEPSGLVLSTSFFSAYHSLSVGIIAEDAIYDPSHDDYGCGKNGQRNGDGFASSTEICIKTYVPYSMLDLVQETCNYLNGGYNG